MDENFFDAGGHSLLATRIVSRIRARHAKDFTLRDMFAAPTIAELAAVLDCPAAGPYCRGSGCGTARYRTAAVLRSGAAVVSRSAGSRQSGLQHRLDGAPERATRAYSAARCTRFSGGAPRVFAQPLSGRRGPAAAVDRCSESLPLLELDLSVASETGLQAELLRHAREPFVLASGPLLRAVLVRRAADEHLLMLVTQHIVTDATSNHVLFDELVTAYAAFADGAEPQLPPLDIRYADYAVWQRQQQADAAQAADLAWWREQLAGMPTALELPTDYPRPAEQQFHGAWIRRTLRRDAGDGIAPPGP